MRRVKAGLYSDMRRHLPVIRIRERVWMVMLVGFLGTVCTLALGVASATHVVSSRSMDSLQGTHSHESRSQSGERVYEWGIPVGIPIRCFEILVRLTEKRTTDRYGDLPRIPLIEIISPTVRVPLMGTYYIPRLSKWGWLVADTVFWTATIMGLRTAIGLVRCVLRRRINCCGACGYPTLPGGKPCPECGGLK